MALTSSHLPLGETPDMFGFRVRVRVRVSALAHAPPLQEFGEMLTMSTKNRIQIFEGKVICAC